MKKANTLKISIITFLLVLVLNEAKAQEKDHVGYFGSVYGMYDIFFTSHEDFKSEGFNFDIYGFVTGGIEFGKYFGQDYFSFSLVRGNASVYESIEEDDVEPYDGEVELNTAYAVALTFRKQINKVRNTNRIHVNLGSRASAIFHHYSGIQAQRIENNSSVPEYEFEKYTFNTIGIETGPYIEVGKHAPGKTGFFLNWEFLYIRVGYNGGGFGTQRLSLIMRF